MDDDDEANGESGPLCPPKGTRRVPKARRCVTLGLVNCAAGLDGCDEQLLPASFRALETDLGFHPSILGHITLAQTLGLSLSCPFWGYLADSWERRLVLSLGCVSWGAVTIALGCVSTFGHIIALRALNGVFLGSIGPISQSVLADVSSRRTRGLHFGFVQMCSCVGRILGGVITTSVSLIDIGGFLGWRLCFIGVGILSSLLGVVIFFAMTEVPRLKRSGSGQQLQVPEKTAGTGEASSAERLDSFDEHPLLRSVFASLTLPTTLLLITEGITGSIPWSAMSFMTLYFQYCGTSDSKAALIQGSLLVGAMIAGPLGGFLGDRIYRLSRFHGRPALAQVSVGLRVPLLFLAFVGTEKEAESFGTFMVLSFTLGLLSISGAAVNRPILAELVAPESRATIFSFIVAIEGSIASLCGAPVVGILAEHVFGYERSTIPVAEMPTELRRKNADALGSALIILTAVPWLLSLIVYSGLHFTYCKDMRRVRAKEGVLAPLEASASLLGPEI